MSSVSPSSGRKKASSLLRILGIFKISNKLFSKKRELLAIETFTRHFKHYLLGRKFKVVTDHRAVQWLHNFKDPDGLTARCLEKLAAFDYEVQHRPGKSIGHAD